MGGFFLRFAAAFTHGASLGHLELDVCLGGGGGGKISIMKVVGNRRALRGTPEDYYRRGRRLNAQMERLNPYPRPRGFVYKARTWAEYEQWRQEQTNPRLW